ncbi:Retrovirus-related Pol polyprotein from transposon RE2 [Vitis vinifera]|uniref:Retrovirus-related Pol polyprotein from transposon RE2 n=1 Tax=Vitis vinifera TaxID=29760 RepID=A0A438D339_VITVI|nr:Retrovirus-related Pol polyprotein from transposon RE2 [Vitis vinifera]
MSLVMSNLLNPYFFTPHSTFSNHVLPLVITIPIPPPAQPPSYIPEVQALDLAPTADHISNTFPPPHQPGPTLQPKPASQQVSTPTSCHSMTTRAKNHITKPIQKLNLHTHLAFSPNFEPTSVVQALKDSNWRKAMSEEYDALVCNGTWELVTPTDITNLVGCKWVFRIKRNFDRFKARCGPSPDPPDRRDSLLKEKKEGKVCVFQF